MPHMTGVVNPDPTAAPAGPPVVLDHVQGHHFISNLELAHVYFSNGDSSISAGVDSYNDEIASFVRCSNMYMEHCICH